LTHRHQHLGLEGADNPPEEEAEDEGHGVILFSLFFIVKDEFASKRKKTSAKKSATKTPTSQPTQSTMTAEASKTVCSSSFILQYR
jgi:hypothetical protein